MSDFQIISPVDGSVLAERTYADNQHIEETLTQSVKAFAGWRSTPLVERKKICEKAVEHLVSHADELALELTQMMGRPIQYSSFEITGGFQERARHMIEISDEALTDLKPAPEQGFNRFVRKEPVGVVLVLSPWNYPYLTAVNAVIPALLAGNCVVLKHAEQTALCAERYHEAFEAAGLPAGVFQFLHVTHDQVAEIIDDSRISHVTFTGSVSGGKAIQKSVNQRFISTGLELGGKDAAYVREDADLLSTVDNLVDGSFFNSGQSCCGIERIYVHADLYDSFIGLFAQKTLEYQLGNPTNPEVTLGPMVSVKAAEKVSRHVSDAIEQGARNLIDSSSFPAHLGMPYLVPAVLIDVNHEMDIMKEETFGPVATIMKVNSDGEAIGLINDSVYGLTASIWTKNEEAAFTLGEKIETGTVYMNRCDYLDPALAWTGVKNSGMGCTLSPMGFDQFIRPKSYHLKLS